MGDRDTVNEDIQETAEKLKEEIARVANEMEKYLTSYSGEPLPMSLFQWVDKIVAWVPYFMKPDSVSLELLEDMEDMEPESEPEPLPEQMSELQTQVAKNLYEQISYWQQSNQTEQVIEYINQFLVEFNQTVDSAMVWLKEYSPGFNVTGDTSHSSWSIGNISQDFLDTVR